MVSGPLVSVVTPFFNTARYLAGCIESVLAQTHRNFEYVLVDNKSTDGSREIAHRYAAQDSRIRLIDNPIFVGQVENYNGALRQVSCDSKYVKMVQADDAIYPTCIERMVELAESDPRLGIVSSYRLVGACTSGEGIPNSLPRLGGREACRFMLLGGPNLFGSPTTLLYRADIVRSREPFFALGRYHEDTEAGYEILLEHDFGFVYEILSFTRTDNISVMTSTRAFNSADLDYLIVLERYGPLVLTADELAKQRARSHIGYYRFLGRALLRMKGAAFWHYHRVGLETVGWKFRWRDVILQAAAELPRLLLNPRSTLKQGVSDVRQRIQSGSRASPS